MTDKERLEEMNRMKRHAIEHDDKPMLLIIEQAERVQELESKNKLLKSNLSVVQGYYKNMIKINKDIVEQNQQYREALEEIITTSITIPDYKEHSLHAELVARRALKGESE
ncbi:hypothetical protein [Virgibacillus pantothenticus]|uniref:Uncharacterized protein n=1 Tax=Virgibacillus pantothenticus TaxID=1473 RepID=A0A0L0QKI0_VIRPA|nr:hypothetical protein [Virgibacillus pantothenticus]KNE19061.1 hypothetical protein AFK71_10905 [Virgibacillus pantothenticus]MED3739364.1 hypothetical protein [Virgibacillus pantothenticus]QTY15507.1 hypothetical protein KBP50_16685 [Virgibacillus pantothenticus]SIT16808.1 hypothetical protein SAMN05421787_12736 [Virgibacillus pantothenticus]